MILMLPVCAKAFTVCKVQLRPQKLCLKQFNAGFKNTDLQIFQIVDFKNALEEIFANMYANITLFY